MQTPPKSAPAKAVEARANAAKVRIRESRQKSAPANIAEVRARKRRQSMHPGTPPMYVNVNAAEMCTREQC